MQTSKDTYKNDSKTGWSYPIDSLISDYDYRNNYYDYRQRLYALYRKADLAGVLEASEDLPVLLRDIYVPLRIDETETDPSADPENAAETKGLSIPNALRRIQFLAISGLPGSGKSTLTKFLAAEMSELQLNVTTQRLGRRIVIPFILRELNFSKIDSFDDLWNVWISGMSKRLGMKITREFLDFYIDNGWAVIIFDGIDEIGTEKNIDLINWINDWIEERKSLREATPPVNVIITGRPYGFLEKGNYKKWFKMMHLQHFNQKESELYAGKWFKVRYGEDKVKVKIKADDFIAALKDYGLKELKRRPIYLAMLAYVAETYGELPRTRTLAYS
ncbi:MAG: NACHT domain-containing protein, partial [Nitrospirae bacterium]|nr:NACHT domain-containing protein [Nitrospirota bacterium]